MIYPGILGPGTRCVVNTLIKNGTFKPGTVGFFSHYRRSVVDNNAIVECKIVTIRRGKSGKARLDYNSMHLPTIFLDEKGYKGFHDGYLTLPMHMVFQADPLVETRVLKLKDLDFLAWALSKIMYLRNLDRNYVNYSFWPKHPANLLNKFKDVVSQQGSGRLDEFLVVYTQEVARIDIVADIRGIETTLAGAIVAYNNNVRHLHHGFFRRTLMGLGIKETDVYKEAKEYIYNGGQYV